MKKTKYSLLTILILFIMSCSKNNDTNPTTTSTAKKCLVSTTIGFDFKDFNYDENNRIKQLLRINLTEKFDDLIKFEYTSNTCYVKNYDVSHIYEDISLYSTEQITLNADGACIKYKNSQYFYNASTKLLDSLVEFNTSTNKPEYVTYYGYDSNKRLTEKNTYYYYGQVKMTMQTIKIEYDNNNTSNTIPLIAGNPLIGYNHNFSFFINYNLLLLSHTLLGKNYPVNGVPVKETMQIYSLGDPYGAPKITNYNYRKNAANQIDSIWQTGYNEEDGYTVTFECK